MSVLGNIVGHAAATLGRAEDYLTPGSGSGTLTDVGRAIYNPNVTLSNPGAINPFVKGSAFSVTPQPTVPKPAQSMPNYTGTTNADGDVLSAQDWNPYTGTYGTGSAASPADLAFLDANEAQLRDLLGRTDTGLNQGLEKLNNDYQGTVNQTNGQKAQALQDYQDNRVTTTKDKMTGYDRINKGANTGYRSLAQIIGRGAGTASSAFQDVLPDVIGRDTSAKRGEVNQVYANNLGQIDNAQKKTELSFENILSDLQRQRQAGEQDLRTGIEGQRQSINGQLGQIAGQRAQANGGGYAAVLAAQQPTQNAITNSRSAVESFFNQFKAPIQAGQATVAAPDLSQYTVDKSNVNAANQGSPDPTNPYSDLLRKKLQEQAV